MSDPITTTIFGYKPSMIVFSIIGSAISLQFAKNLSWWQGIVTVASGFLVSVVAVPGYFEYKVIKAIEAGSTAPKYSLHLENAVSFFTAMFAMAVISMIFKSFDKLDMASKISKAIDKKLGL